MCLAHIPSQSGQGTEKMILEEETFREFGYISSELKPQSAKKILAACDDCGKVRAIQKCHYSALCISCTRESAKTRRKISEAMKGRIPWNKNKPLSDRHKRKISDGNKGKTVSEETRRKIGEAIKGEKNHFFGKHPSEEARQKMREAQKGNKNSLGTHRSEETKRKMGEASKKNWQDPIYIKKVFDGLNMKPNAQEKKVGAFLQKHLPNEYAYNGDFSCGITIGGKIPDFVNVNGEKIVIEVFGPWHDEQYMRDHFDRDISWKRTEFGTKAFYSQFGYKCVVFWQEDLEREDVDAFVLHTLREEGVIK